MIEQEVKKGSRLVPFIVLAVIAVVFVSVAIKMPSPVTNSEPGVAMMLAESAAGLTHDIPLLLMAQLKTVWVLVLFAIVPGVLGMTYRRAFWTWFMVAFVILYAMNWGFHATGKGSIASDWTEQIKLDWSEQFFLTVEVLIIQLLLIFRLRRFSIQRLDAKSKRNNIMLGVALILLVVGWVYSKGYGLELGWWETSSVSVLLIIALTIVYQSLASREKQGEPRKNILVCLDGTWNQPGTLDFGQLAETNVFKLFSMAKGKPPAKQYNANLCKEYLGEKADPAASARQIAFYYHGVGNKTENSQLGQLFGGAFGMGAGAIVERAYLDVLRVYRPGDRIFIFGFSRGAAIARLLAGVIDRRVTPTSLWTLRLFGRHWSVWKSFNRKNDTDKVKVTVLGCWDTVAAFGIPKNILGIPFQKVNLLKDLTVPLCVERAYHMLALDETRESFAPTLMDLDPIKPTRIIEVWFSGNHSNVGGGYATDRLSNLTLDFLLRHISSGYAHEADDLPGDESWGLYVNAMRKTDRKIAVADDITVINPDPRGRLRHSTGAAYTHAPRTLPIHAVIHDSVFERMKDVLPVYAPQSLFNLNDELVLKRDAIKKEVGHLSITGSISEDEGVKILNWSQEKLTLTKWSEYQELELEDQSRMLDHMKSSEVLDNSES